MNDARDERNAQTAGPGHVRVEGILDMVRASDAQFILRTDGGQDIHGKLVGRPVEELARLLNRRVVVFGAAVLSPSGDYLRFDADGFLAADGPVIVSPDHLPLTQEEKEEMARRLRSVAGKWPGNETDEEVTKALREMS